MAIKLQTEKTSIPVEIGKLKFEFDVTDDSMLKLRKKAAEVQDEVEAIEESQDEAEKIEQIKDILKRGYDLFLGEGSFEKLYKQTPSVMRLHGYFVDLAEAIFDELENMGMNESQKEKVQKYLK